ncbi:MAG TPA: hypothetical protein VFD70_21755, partial [Anaerolineae bacterium]|nr:hypothetical protein [Anaerolineae bacterium]
APTFASDGLVLTGVPGGILRSVNRGDTWEIIALGAPPVTVTTFVFSPDFEKDGIVLAGTLEDGVFLSNDRGSRWAAWNFGLLDLHVLSLVISPTFSEDETIFAGTESGIARSTNGGRAWRDLGLDGSLPLTFAEPILSLALSPSYAADGIVFAGTETNGLICSCARGKSWKRIAENFIADPVNGIVIGKNELSQSTIAVLQSDALLVSHNGGSDWEQVEAPALDAELENDVTSWSAIAAPEGLGKGARLLVGLTNGNIRFVIL